MVFDGFRENRVPLGGDETENVGANFTFVLVNACVFHIVVVHLPVDRNEAAVRPSVMNLVDAVFDVVEDRLEVELARPFLEFHLDVLLLLARDELPLDWDSAILQLRQSDEGLRAEIDVSRLAFRTSIYHFHRDFTQRAEYPYTGATGVAAVVLGVVHGAVEEIILRHIDAAIAAVGAGHTAILGSLAGKPCGVTFGEGESVERYGE